MEIKELGPTAGILLLLLPPNIIELIIKQEEKLLTFTKRSAGQ